MRAMRVKAEVSTILRRLVRIAATLDQGRCGHLHKAARTLDPDGLRRLAREVLWTKLDRDPESLDPEDD